MMRRNILFSILFIILCYNLSAQTTISPIEKYLHLKQKSISPDQLFVHLDRNKYKPGDTIYFQAYIRDRFTNEFESKSVSLYALLFDDNKVKLDSSRFKIDNSTCSGWMSIPLEAKSGKYHFAALTSIMQNFDPSEAFQSDILVKGPDKIIVENDPSFDSQYFELKFLPEGGNSVQGLEQRIGFNATDGKGDPVYIEGLLKNSSGLTLDTIKSGAYGPGSFVCTPEPGMYVEIIRGNSNKNTWQLPIPVISGICLSVKPINNKSFSIEIQSNKYKNDTLTVTGVMNSNQIFLQNLVMNKKQRVVIETDQLPSGVAQITIFNKDLNPLAERLYYVNSDKHLTFKIVPTSQIYSIGQETELSISVNDGFGNPSTGFFSISVTDSISGHAAEICTQGIEAVLNFNPCFQRNLPQKVLMTGLENLTSEDRDLMFMIYGWSRYKWDFSDNQTAAQDLVNYDLINIKILGKSRVHASARKLDLISLEGPSVIHLLTKINGEISLGLDSLPGNTHTVTLIPGNEKKKVAEANLSIVSNPGYFNDKKFLTEQPALSPKILTPKQDDFRIPSGNNLIEIPPVTIKGYPKVKVKYQNIYEDRYKYANIKSSDPELIHTSWDLESAIRRMVPTATITNDAVFIRGGGGGTSFFGSVVGALIVLDGMPLYSNGWPIAKTYSINEIASVSVLKGKQGVTIYGLEAGGGVIFVNTLLHDPTLNHVYTKWKSQNKNSNLLLPVKIYRSNIEFYNQGKFDIDNDPDIQKGSTYYWNPEVYFNGKDPVKIKYLNLNHTGPVLVIINGASVNNLIGTGRARYQVN
jgi:hypothetical protein